MDIVTRRHDAVLAIEFNRPQKKNAFTNDMYVALAEALRDAEGDDSVRAVVFHEIGRAHV